MGGKEKVSPQINVASRRRKKKMRALGVIEAITDIMGAVLGSSSYLDACFFC
jgi:hypothetical protein